ncbi:MAG: TIGR02147 family protein [Deltaproteobacteria bacterium]|nr:TIGR02147 family protein [Deltaproteobacteria bacterium]
MNTPSNIYNFGDYREFLKDRYKQLKETDPVFSFRNFSKQAGFGSPNYLKLVMDGKRNLSADAIGKFAKGLRLDSHESEFFKYMVECNQCDSTAKQKVYEAKLMYLRELFKVKSLIPELYDYYHEWYHSAIRETVKKGKVKNDPAAIAKSLVPNINEEEAKKSIELLTALKFVEVNAEGLLEARESGCAVDAETSALSQKIHYEQMAELAAQSLYTQGPETQDFESVTVSLPIEKVAELKSKIQALIQAAVKEHSNNPDHAMFQLNVQLFAITQPMGGVKKGDEKAA